MFQLHLQLENRPLRRTKRELREDKGERVDKDAVLRERINPAPDC
jgi:hypothetical protein